MNQNYVTWKQWNPLEFGIYSENNAKYFSWHLSRATSTLRKDICVLEIGFGNGRFLGYCRDRGYKVMGVERNPDLVDRARNYNYEVFGNLKDISGTHKFDLVVAFDVLEHFDEGELSEFFEVLPGLLEKNGFFIARVPNGDSPFGRRHQHGDLTHKTTYGEFKFHQIAHQAGMIVAAVGESPWYIDESQAPSLKRAIAGIVRAITNFVIGYAYFHAKVDMSSNLVVVLRNDAKSG